MSKELQQQTNQTIKPSSSGSSISKINIDALKVSLGNPEIPRLFFQLVLFVLDGSASMRGEGMSGKSKGEEIEDAIKPIIKRLQKSKHNNSFDIGMFAYSDDTVEMLPVTSVKDIQTDSNLNPCAFLENSSTYIENALIKAEQQTQFYLSKHQDKIAQVLILILSDGALHDQEVAVRVTNRLKTNNKVTIASYLFEDKSWKERASEAELNQLRGNLCVLSSMSDTDPTQFFKSTIDPEEVRKHMIKSISTVSSI